MNDARESLTRRHFLRTSLHGIGGVALASMFARESFALGQGSPPLVLPHFPPRAKRIICLWQGGGPSHVDLFDPKPELARFQGQDIPESVRKEVTFVWLERAHDATKHAFGVAEPPTLGATAA